MNTEKIGVLIPTRGDRELFLSQAMRMLERQTTQHDLLEVVNYSPKSAANDITERYKYGYESLSRKGAKIIVCWEDDDWYSGDYITTMVRRWKNAGRPDIYGIDHTTYYHLRVRRWIKMQHAGRASMMSTILRAGRKINWDHDPGVFLDVHLWKTIPGKAEPIGVDLCVGIKHAIGKSAGVGHRGGWNGYKNTDPDGRYLQSIVGSSDWNFYNEIIR